MNRLLAVTRQSFEDSPARWIGKGSEDVIGNRCHGKTITKWLLIVKLEKALLHRQFHSMQCRNPEVYSIAAQNKLHRRK
jgi:hypothetical protein